MNLPHETVAIRELLTAAFADEQLTILCFDHFRSVYESFGAGMGKTQKIQLLLEHCERHFQLDKLLALVREFNPTQYEHWASLQQATFNRISPAPAASHYFTGRSQLLAQLSLALTNPQGATIALHGMGGVGKTALAKKLAEDLQPNFRGGILWADLPLTNGNATAILQSWGRSWGVSLTGESNPASLVQIARGFLSDHQTKFGRLLIIVDDVREDWLEGAKLLEQATPGQASLLLTTREDNLARALTSNICLVDKLEPDQALELLGQHAGKAVIEAEIATATDLLAHLGGLPLAIKLAGQWLAKFARKYRSRVVAELKDALTKQGLPSLALPDQPELTATFALSYQGLADKEQRLFYGLGVFAGGSFRLPSVAKVMGVTLADTEKILDELVNLALLDWGERAADGALIYTIHPLLKQYAQLLLAQSVEAEQIQQAYIGVYLALAEANAQNTPEAHDRLEAELADLLHAAKLAAELGQHQVVSNFALALWEKGEFLDTRGYYRQALTLLEKTIQAARILADEATEAIHLKNMGRVQRNLGNLKEAENYYLLSLNYYRRSDNNKLQLCDLCYHLAFCYILQGRYQEASALIEQNLAIAVFIQDILVQKRIEAQSHYTLGNIAIGQNQWVEAQKYIEMSLQLYEDLSDATGRAESLYNLGVILTRQGNDLARASLCYQQSLEHWRTTGQFKSAAHTIFQIAILEQSQGNFTQAFIYLDQAEEVGRKIGDLLTQAMTKMHRGLTYLATQNKAAACQEWQVALELLGDKLPHWQERIMALVNMHCLDSNNVAV